MFDPSKLVINNFHHLSLPDRNKITKCFMKNTGLYLSKYPNDTVITGPLRIFTRCDIEVHYASCYKKHKIASVYYVPWLSYDEAWIIKPYEDWNGLLKEVDEVLVIANMIDIIEK